MLSTFARSTRALGAGLVLAVSLPLAAQDAARGAGLYLRAPDGGRSCVACHGPDPAANPNNILRAADNPDALTKALNTVSQMGFLRPQLTDADRADLAGFLGTVAQPLAQAPHLWPATVEFGAVVAGQAPAAHPLRLRNTQAVAVTVTRIAATGGATVSHDCPQQLAAGDSCNLRVRLGATGTGWVREAVQVALDGTRRPLLAGLSVEGRTEAVSALRWADAPETLRFDTAGRDGDGVVRQRLRLHNDGPMPAVLAQATIVGPQASQFHIEQRCAGTASLQAGTSCDVVLAFTPGLLARAEAVLQLRSDQGHPASLLLEGTGAQQAAAQAPQAVVPLEDGGGGCSTKPSGSRRVDPTLPLLAAAAALAAWGRRRGLRGFG